MNNSIPLVQMVLQSDIATIVVLCILAIMSLGSWGIIIVKFFTYRRSKHANAEFFRKFSTVTQFVQLQGLCETAEDSALRRLTAEVLKEASTHRSGRRRQVHFALACHRGACHAGGQT